MREIIERITDAYAAFNQLDIDRALAIPRLHRKYGSRF
jgi:hypothetical protein